MAKNVTIPVENRDFSVNVKKLRETGKIPATIYGHGLKNLSIQIDAKSFMKEYKQDKTAIFALQLADHTYNALAKNVQFTNLGDQILNIEFHRVLTDEKVKITVPVEIVGESPAVKAGGVVWNPVTEVEVECLPDNIPTNIEIDISELQNIEDALMVGEIKYPEGVNPASSQESIVVKINPSKIAETTTEAAA